MVSEKRRFIKFVSVWPSDDVDLSLLTETARGADMEAQAVFLCRPGPLISAKSFLFK